jgi:hypothetical protein
MPREEKDCILSMEVMLSGWLREGNRWMEKESRCLWIVHVTMSSLSFWSLQYGEVYQATNERWRMSYRHSYTTTWLWSRPHWPPQQSAGRCRGWRHALYILEHERHCKIPTTSLRHIYCCDYAAHALGRFNPDDQRHLLDCRNTADTCRVLKLVFLKELSYNF